MTKRKILSETILDRREYAGATFHKKKQRYIEITQSNYEVQHLETGHRYNTLCHVLVYYERVVEERANLVKGTFLEHAGTPRKRLRQTVIPPKGTKLSECKAAQRLALGKQFSKIAVENAYTKACNVAAATGKSTFFGDKVINPIKFNFTEDQWNSIRNKKVDIIKKV
jgi:hypothetical protein